jgi:hypothetical protein
MKLERWMVVAALFVSTGILLQPAALAKGKKGNKQQQQQQPQQEDTQTEPTYTPPATQPTDPLSIAAAAMATAAKKARADYEAGADWKAANDNWASARDTCNTATANVTVALKTRPDYVAAVAAKIKAEDDLDALRNSGTATDDQISVAADNAMTARTAVTQMESSASTTDPTVVDAKAKLAIATAAMADQRNKEELAVQADPDWQAAKKQFDDAKASLASAANR